MTDTQGMNKLPPEKRAQLLGMMAEGVSLRSITRLTGVSRTTSLKLLVDAGYAFSDYQDRTLRNLPCKRVQVDEIWSFVEMKAKNVPKERRGEYGIGDVWTWKAIDADSKLVPSWFVGNRDAEHARTFLADLASRMAGRIQLTSDALPAYRDAVHDTFLDEIDYAQLVKMYGESPEAEKRYSPPVCIGCESKRITGKPDPKHISTSFVERQNLNIRMGLRRFTRLTNAFSKKFENHVHGLAIYFMYYNFVRIHQTTRVTPAMAADVTDKLWELSDLVRVVEEYETAERDPTMVENIDLERLRNDAGTYTPGRLRRVRSNLEDDGFSS